MVAVRQRPEPRFPEGLEGQWVSVEELAELDLFKSGKRAFKVKLNTNFAPQPGKPEPGIKAAVRREYQPGELICRAGEYGSTAFLLLEGSALSFVPDRAEPQTIPGRSRGSFARIKDMFARRTQVPRTTPPDPLAVGEVSRYASLSTDATPPPVTLGPGDFFGIDTCINFYPRETSVRAEERCVVIEMLRSVLDTIRDAGSASGKIEESYAGAAIRNQLRLSRLLRDLSDDEVESLAASAALLDPDSDQVKDGVIYAEGDAADAVYLIRAGTVKVAQVRDGTERIFSYLGRGSAFGFENILPSRQKTPLVLRCTSHPELLAPLEIKGSLTIGRGATCEIALPRDNAAVGRKHARLEERDGDVAIVDLESANFTLLNGERVQRATLKSGDRITIVEYVFEVSREPLEQTVMAAPIVHRATVTGLDDFEIVRVDVAAIKSLARRNDRFAASLTQVARSLEGLAYREGGGGRDVVREMVELNLYNSQNTLLIDLERCTRCDECVKACSDAHDGVARFTRDGPRFGKYLVTMACRSCTDPKCMIGCPVGSIRRTDSLEIQIEDWCIGCERCANQCPFGNINMVEKPAAPAPKPAAGKEPAAAEAVKLKATVCDLCSGYDSPNCVYACPHDAAIRVNPAEFLSATDLTR
jgi:Fe-S-cluster-containing hydrogenase component 2/CRP-like cAMP-binding protein